MLLRKLESMQGCFWALFFFFVAFLSFFVFIHLLLQQPFSSLVFHFSGAAPSLLSHLSFQQHNNIPSPLKHSTSPPCWTMQSFLLWIGERQQHNQTTPPKLNRGPSRSEINKQGLNIIHPISYYPHQPVTLHQTKNQTSFYTLLNTPLKQLSNLYTQEFDSINIYLHFIDSETSTLHNYFLLNLNTPSETLFPINGWVVVGLTKSDLQSVWWLG